MTTMNKAEMRAYVISKLVGGVKLITAAKVVPVKAEQVTSKGVLDTVLASGFVEAKGTKLMVGDWVLTNPKSERYKNDDSYFQANYAPAPDLGEGMYRPKGGAALLFFQTDEDLTFEASWGTQTILAGGYIRVDNLGDIYGNAKDEFEANYKETSPDGTFIS